MQIKWQRNEIFQVCAKCFIISFVRWNGKCGVIKGVKMVWFSFQPRILLIKFLDELCTVSVFVCEWLFHVYFYLSLSLSRYLSAPDSLSLWLSLGAKTIQQSNRVQKSTHKRERNIQLMRQRVREEWKAYCYDPLPTHPLKLPLITPPPYTQPTLS